MHSFDFMKSQSEHSTSSLAGVLGGRAVQMGRRAGGSRPHSSKRRGAAAAKQRKSAAKEMLVEQHEHYTGEPTPKLAYCSSTPRALYSGGGGGEPTTTAEGRLLSTHKHTDGFAGSNKLRLRTPMGLGRDGGRPQAFLLTWLLLRMILRKSPTESFSPLGFERVDSIQNVSLTYLQMENMVSAASPHDPRPSKTCIAFPTRVEDRKARQHQIRGSDSKEASPVNANRMRALIDWTTEPSASDKIKRTFHPKCEGAESAIYRSIQCRQSRVIDSSRTNGG